MYTYPELELALEDMLTQNELYRPTVFWDEASSSIVSDLRTYGVERFRSLPSALNFFVPTYGMPGSSFTKVMFDGLLAWLRREFPQKAKPCLALDQFLSGNMAALADYRVLLGADDLRRQPYLHTFSESTVGEPVEQFKFDGRRFSRSSFNYLLGLAMLKKHLDGDVLRTVMEIGGGFGTLGEVLSAGGINALRYIDIDIPPTSFVAQHYLNAVLGSDNVGAYEETRDQVSIYVNSLPQATVLCSWQIEKLQGKVDLFVNFMSFQEMEPHIVENYLDHVGRFGTRWVLLRNIREGKQVRKWNSSVGVNNPILTNDYLAMLPGYELVERNVLPFGYRTVDGYHSELLLMRRCKV
ncbi:MAG: putative sugar O-methyltransferase [Chloroflexi bacterium]|nr:putative sugar O-methyltransferase [Chloroflexota bacterium]